MLFKRTYLVCALSLCLSYSPALAQTKPLIHLSRFQPHNSNADPQAAGEIHKELSQRLTAAGYTVKETEFTSNQAALTQAKNDGAAYYIGGYYQSSQKEGLTVYLQIYDPAKGYIIDALYSENPWRDLEEPPVAIATATGEQLSKLAGKLVIRLQANPGKKIRRGNINDYILGRSVKDEVAGLLPKKEKIESVAETFKILEEQEITIVSKQVGRSEKTSRTAAIVTVFSRQDIADSGARNLTDVLKVVPGVEVFYDQFGFFKVSFRGIRSKSGVLLLLNGHRLNNFYDGSTFLNIRADAIEKVEIIRGPGSSVHGANAFVGVINVITRKVQAKNGKKNQGELNARFGSFWTVEGSAHYGFTNGGWSYHALGHYYRTDGQSRRIQNDQTCDPDADAAGTCAQTTVEVSKGKFRTNDEKEQINAVVQIEHEAGFSVSAAVLHENRGPFFGPLLNLTPDSDITFDHYLLDLAVPKYEFGSKLRSNARVYGDFYHKDDNIQVIRPDDVDHVGKSARQKLGYNINTIGSEIITQYDYNKNGFLLLGLQVERQAVSDFEIIANFQRTNLDVIRNSFRDYDDLPIEQNKDRLATGVYLQGNHNVLPNLNLTAGLRFDHYNDFGSALNPKGGVVYLPIQSKKYGTVTLKALYGEAFRAPTFQELYDQTQKFLDSGVFGNTKLKPETIRTYEAGVEYNTLWKPLTVLYNVYYNQITNNIEGINVSGIFPTDKDQYQNFNGIDTIGYEAEVRLRLTKDTYGFANYSWFETKDLGNLSEFGDEDTEVVTYRLDVPQWRANAGVMFGYVPYVNIYNALWFSGDRAANYRFVFETQPKRRFSIDSYFLWNFRIENKPFFLKNLKISVSIFNVLDTKVYDDYNIAEEVFGNRRFRKEGRYIEGKVSYVL